MMVKKFYIEDAADGYAVKYSESAPAGFSEISDPLEIEKQYRRLYKKRAKDGLALHDTIRANLAIMLDNSLMTEDQVYEIEKKLLPAKSFLLSGNWLMAFHDINLQSVDTNYTQAVHDDIRLRLESYINENY